MAEEDGGNGSVDQEVPEEEKEKQNIIPGYKSFNDYAAEGYRQIALGVKAANGLPAARNYQFYQTYTNFKDVMKETGGQLQDLMEDLLMGQGLKRGIKNVMMEDAQDAMMLLNDKTLDRCACLMDMMEGIKTGLSAFLPSAKQPVSGSWNKAQAKETTNQVTLSLQRNVPRPQFQFLDKIDNSNRPWEPKIKEKPNAKKPLAILVEMTEDGEECYSHPYEYELDLWSVPDKQLLRTRPIRPKPLDDTPWSLVVNEQDLEALLKDLTDQEIIGVDLEHHSYRSFMGFTCLMQISTKDKDYVIDTLALRHALHALNDVFTNPSILKVFHGADLDIGWLQRDFGLYVVNMFDTHQASKLLGYPKLSLGYLLQHFCQINADKHFQLFDWRTRPLPDSAIKYAREDTHYLLYIYQAMSNQLLDKANGNTNLLEVCYDRSRHICKKRYIKPLIDEDSYMMAYRKGKRKFDNRQLFALKGLFLWRDKTAREQDESLSYVLPDHMMLHIAEILPREAQGILACCNPIPPLVKSNLLELHYLIVQAKDQPLVKVVVPEANPIPVAMVKAGAAAEQQLLDQWYHSSEAGQEGLPTLLDGSLPQPPSPSDSPNHKPQLTIFEEGDETTNDDDSDLSLLESLKDLNFTSPYQRYIKVLPYVLELEKEEQERERKRVEQLRQKQLMEKSQIEEIKEVEKLGIIKLDREKEKEDATPLKIQVQKGKKRKSEEAWTNGGVGGGTTSNKMMKREKGDSKRGARAAAGVKLKQESKGGGEKVADDDDDGRGGGDDTDGSNVQQRMAQQIKRGNWKDFKIKNKKIKEEEEKEFEPYDFSKVDFSKFQSDKPKEQHGKRDFPSHFQGKGKRKDGNFGPPFPNKKRRGRR